MSDFHERLAHLTDTVRALPGGEAAARALLHLAADVDGYLAEQQSSRYDRWPELLQKWNQFTIAITEDAHRHHEDKVALERRKLARAVAADSRWQGGYADALALFEEEQSHGH